MKKRGRRGFTLIELLVVIAIIAILAAILFPVFAAAKQRAWTVRCLGNIRQLANAVRMYTDENNGRLPSNLPDSYAGWPAGTMPYDWAGSPAPDKPCYVEKGPLFRYVNNKALYLCPVDYGRPATQWGRLSGGSPQAQKEFPLSYAMNANLWGDPDVPKPWPSPLPPALSQPMQLDRVHHPGRVLLLIHEKRESIDNGHFGWDMMGDPNQNFPGKSHYDGAPIVYCDGHAKYRTFSQMIKDVLDKVWEPGNK